jgi:hypothetical protein
MMHEPFGIAMAAQAGTFFYHAGVSWALFQTLETSELFSDCMTFSDLYEGHRTAGMADVLCWCLWIVQTECVHICNSWRTSEWIWEVAATSTNVHEVKLSLLMLRVLSLGWLDCGWVIASC